MTGAARQPVLRFLLVIDLLFWAGAETQLRHLAIGLAKQGHRVTLLAIDDATSYVDDLEEAGVELRVLGVKSRLGKLAALPRMVRLARQTNLVHCTGWDASLWGRLAAIAARRPVVVTEHSAGRSYQVSRSGGSRSRLIALHNRVLDPGTAATVIVAEAQREMLEAEGVRPGSIVRIPNAVPLAELRCRAEQGADRAGLGVPADAKLLIHAARFTPPKGQPITLRTVARLRERLGDVRVVFAGAGPEEERVKREAEQLGAEWATFLGSRDDVPALLRAADLTVLPSAAEGLPMSLIESMAVGTPVVATDVGDVRWLLSAGGGGICVAAGDEDGFLDACARVLGDDHLHRQLSEAGSSGVADFDAPRMAERYADVFEAAIAGGSVFGLLVCLIPAVTAFLLFLALRSRSGPVTGGDRGNRSPIVLAEAPRRRILLVINRLFWAGAETQLRNLAIGLSEAGHEVTLLAVEEVVSYRAELEAAGVELRELEVHDRIGKLRALPALYRAAREADVVQCTGWDASLWGRLAAIAARRPVVVAEHSGDRSMQVSKSGAPRARLIALHNRLLDRSTSATVVVSTAQPQQLEAEGVHPDSIALIPNGVPIDELRHQARDGSLRSSLAIPADATMVVHVARFIPQKGQATTLRVVAGLRERFGDVRAVFAGDGETEEEVRRLAAEMGAEWATFLGSRDDVPALLRAADLTVLPSAAEGLPMSLIESIAVGTPVVATAVGDVPWLLEEVGGGRLVPAADEAAFTEACAELVADPALRERLSEEGITLIDGLDATRMVERYSLVLEGAIASVPPADLTDDLTPER